MKHSIVVLMGLFLTSSILHAMEITEKDFVFKEIEHSYYKTEREFFDFVNKKDSHRTFANHELLWADRDNFLPKDIKNEILKIRYKQIISDKYIRREFNFCRNDNNFCDYRLYKEMFDGQYSRDIFWANKGQQKAIYYFWNSSPNNLVIEGVNIQFSQEMAKQIDSLSKSIKLKLKKPFGDFFYVQTDEPTLQNNIDRLSSAAKLLISGMFIIVLLYVYMKINNTDFRQGLKLAVGSILAAGALGGIAEAMEKQRKMVMATRVGIAVEATTVGVAGIAIIGGTIGTAIDLLVLGNKPFFSLGIATPGALVIGDLITGAITKALIQESLQKRSMNEDEEMAKRGFEKRYFFPTLKDKK